LVIIPIGLFLGLFVGISWVLFFRDTDVVTAPDVVNSELGRDQVAT
jgi:hypothetical protein